MPARTNCSPPNILCTCGDTIAYPILTSLPPVGVERMCLSCYRLWKLDEYTFTDTGGTRWSWTAEDVPETNVIGQTLLSLDAALAELSAVAGPVRGLA